jgi:hypothetical protein
MSRLAHVNKVDGETRPASPKISAFLSFAPTAPPGYASTVPGFLNSLGSLGHSTWSKLAYQYIPKAMQTARAQQAERVRILGGSRESAWAKVLYMPPDELHIRELLRPIDTRLVGRRVYESWAYGRGKTVNTLAHGTSSPSRGRFRRHLSKRRHCTLSTGC